MNKSRIKQLEFYELTKKIYLARLESENFCTILINFNSPVFVFK